jgi:hypothetical protein
VFSRANRSVGLISGASRVTRVLVHYGQRDSIDDRHALREKDIENTDHQPCLCCVSYGG